MYVVMVDIPIGSSGFEKHCGMAPAPQFAVVDFEMRMKRLYTI